MRALVSKRSSREANNFANNLETLAHEYRHAQKLSMKNGDPFANEKMNSIEDALSMYQMKQVEDRVSKLQSRDD